MTDEVGKSRMVFPKRGRPRGTQGTAVKAGKGSSLSKTLGVGERGCGVKNYFRACFPTCQTASLSAGLWHEQESFVNTSVAGTRMELGVGFHRRALKKWWAEAGTDEAGSYFQLSSRNHFWESLKPECVGRGREKARGAKPLTVGWPLAQELDT